MTVKAMTSTITLMTANTTAKMTTAATTSSTMTTTASPTTVAATADFLQSFLWVCWSIERRLRQTCL